MIAYKEDIVPRFSEVINLLESGELKTADIKISKLSDGSYMITGEYSTDKNVTFIPAGIWTT
jgi:hypothetical protein